MSFPTAHLIPKHAAARSLRVNRVDLDTTFAYVKRPTVSLRWDRKAGEFQATCRDAKGKTLLVIRGASHADVAGNGRLWALEHDADFSTKVTTGQRTAHP